MKIIIRHGIMNPDITVVHPVADDYSDIGAFDKVNLRGEDAYKALKELLASTPEVVGSELGNINEGLALMKSGGKYSPPKGSLIARITPPDPNGLAFSDNMELENLSAIIDSVKKMRSGDSNIAIEDRIENPPQRDGQGTGSGRPR